MQKNAVKQQIRTSALAKRADRAGSPEWFRKIAVRHGSTSPLKLEHRRQGLTARIVSIEKSIKVIQELKKQNLERMAAELKRYADARAGARNALRDLHSDPKTAEPALAEYDGVTAVRTEEIKQVFHQQIFSLEVAAAQLTSNASMIEGLTAIFDALTLRIPCRIKGTNKKGFTRTTTAAMADDITIASFAAEDTLRELQSQFLGFEDAVRLHLDMKPRPVKKPESETLIDTELPEVESEEVLEEDGESKNGEKA